MKKNEQSNTVVLKVSAEVEVPVEKAWELFNTPEHIVNWNAASPDWHTPKASNDLRTGGNFSYRMEARDGSFGFDFAGEYTEVVPMTSFAYKMEDGRTARVEFHPIETGTLVITQFDAENSNPLEMQQNGWQAILDNFKRYAENL
ncbi:SRPBCC family protein [Flavihumibacter cheonanensis]|uniref:SRPBCC family protein n=1 Tax=Flavihumibacter cheonanensis TaxID=1442385 RepID=UPI001EF99C5E|nr:SRPBCC family protein [Flavihumibacter cheonanensis]MCG7753815.1 SRPBCC family protein [Flavihumibacter cheonanensis]